MARRTKKTTKAERRRRAKLRAVEQEAAVAQDAATILCCSAKTAMDFIESCLNRLDDIESELGLDLLASRLWSEHAQDAELAGVLHDFVAEQERHMTAIGRLALRFKAIADQGHRHLPMGAVDQQELYEALFSAPDADGEDAGDGSQVDLGADAAAARVVP
jgi:hypothetical protein